MPQSQLHINLERLQADIEYLAKIGATEQGGITRLALSNNDLAARAWFANRCQEVGLWTHDDEVGNQSGTLKSTNPNAKSLLIGSHLDTVPNGGRFDGALGILAGLECLRTIKESEISLPNHLEVIDFTDEEGTWFSFFGSMGLTGMLKPDHLNDTQTDNAGFRAALFRAGIRLKEVERAKRDTNNLLGYIELHIEQGDRLDEAKADVGIVTHIVGRATYNLTFFGEASHSGTTRMNTRRDALQGASAFILVAHQTISEDFPEGVVNCGNVQVIPGAFNVVPSQASLRMEFRHPDKVELDKMKTSLLQLLDQCVQDYGLTVRVEPILHRPAELLSGVINQAVAEACQTVKANCMEVVSYAGHDAQILNQVIPASMIFVPSVNGLSHNPNEYTSWEHIEKGANVLLHTILNLAQKDTL